MNLDSPIILYVIKKKLLFQIESLDDKACYSVEQINLQITYFKIYKYL